MTHLAKDHGAETIGFRFLRLPEVCKITGLGKTSVWTHARKGTFPRPVKVLNNVTAWRSDEVADWMASRERALDPIDGGHHVR